nr:hypothetical protein [Corynebacterium guaraldiae]
MGKQILAFGRRFLNRSLGRGELLARGSLGIGRPVRTFLGQLLGLPQLGFLVRLFRALLLQVANDGLLLLRLRAKVGLALQHVRTRVFSCRMGDGIGSIGSAVGGTGDLIQLGLGIGDIRLCVVKLLARRRCSLARLVCLSAGVVEIDQRTVDGFALRTYGGFRLCDALLNLGDCAREVCDGWVVGG